MRIIILSRSRTCYSTRRLVEAAENRGHKVGVRYTLRLTIDLSHGDPDLYFKG